MPTVDQLTSFTDEPTLKFGTEAQQAVVEGIMARPDFKQNVELSYTAACIPAMTRRMPRNYLWYDVEDTLHVMRLSVTGRVLFECSHNAKKA
jgi:hypothetical protein